MFVLILRDTNPTYWWSSPSSDPNLPVGLEQILFLTHSRGKVTLGLIIFVNCLSEPQFIHPPKGDVRQDNLESPPTWDMLNKKSFVHKQKILKLKRLPRSTESSPSLHTAIWWQGFPCVQLAAKDVPLGWATTRSAPLFLCVHVHITTDSKIQLQRAKFEELISHERHLAHRQGN